MKTNSTWCDDSIKQLERDIACRCAASMSSVMDQLRAAVESSDESAYAIAKGSGVARSQVSRLLSRERDLSWEAAERRAEYLGLEIVVRPKRGKRRSK